ncbi:MAG: helix-turn-helix domain-containing protein [Mycolicibacterium sp.]|nr:helix-turn-helix domain-containing protein [Mycobacterium sp.]MCB9409581.1 helix-turn-helix domain-containing protein [Mycolicibacterium sp.]
MERISITVVEAAAMTGLKQPAIYRLVKSGEIESRRLGGRILIPLAPLKKQFGL